MPQDKYDVVVLGAGPNGFAAAITLASAGLSTLLVEGKPTPGGGARTEELTAPGFLHDVCSTVHPLGAASPFFHALRLERYGLQWIDSPSAVAHVLADHSVVTLEKSIEETARQFGADADAYRRLVEPFTERFDSLARMILGPLRFPSSPLLLARFGLPALQSMKALCRNRFRGDAVGGLLGGIAAHAMLPLDLPATASFGLVLACAGHAAGWPIARGGSRAITQALVSCLRAVGGELVLNRPIRRLSELPRARAYVLDVTPKQLLGLTTDELPASYRRRLERFRYGAGVFKMDWALREAIPWKDARCKRSATVHLSGTIDDISRAEAAVHGGHTSGKPFVLVVQPTLFDATRAPAGQHIAWAYCHVPHGDLADRSQLIEDHIEHFAPGFRDCVLARSSRNTLQVEHHNPNYIGGDINGGVSDLAQLFFRPVAKVDPYATPASNIFLCSSSTPPGGGVHGMCGYFAARSALTRVFARPLGELAHIGR